MNEHSGNSGQLQGAEDLRQAVHHALGQALGDSYDCTRVWEAWQVGTMIQDDFSLITDDSDRMWEITDAVMAALAARQPVGVEPVAWQWRSRVKGGAWDAWENGRYGSEPAPFMEVQHRALYTAPPALAAVPVDVRDALNWLIGTAALHDRQAAEPYVEVMRTWLAAAPQLSAAKEVPELFVQWLEREMPAGTIIGKPAWWARKLARALRSAERGVLGGCNG
ncbi:hypothetical protein X12_001576 [Xanthomonas arboricola]|uniref:hypothetical protein n=1 Tax=Xanthomonas arboricola TaxID=56448 RepID=UPI00069F1F1A|nr:hypothetical protein [Xanthomonas arboricola]KOA99534.1 hypothetical protein AE921_11980 [Xanthomonas arboricola]KOB05486.1 hypothetical protein AE922_17430 [Xanthomonas arboricola]KOB06431.1 hypothetical protein AE923_16175 [Xanthomonas arboricola]KOB14281.1 hypothetical protein AE925_19715 [Xanthomonas arboricola]KOB20874.1 hypothetical protein AE926_20510 [Xanthomonas arboricola]